MPWKIHGALCISRMLSVSGKYASRHFRMKLRAWEWISEITMNRREDLGHRDLLYAFPVHVRKAKAGHVEDQGAFVNRVLARRDDRWTNIKCVAKAEDSL